MLCVRSIEKTAPRIFTRDGSTYVTSLSKLLPVIKIIQLPGSFLLHRYHCSNLWSEPERELTVRATDITYLVRDRDMKCLQLPY